jgi:hypothetical protein
VDLDDELRRMFANVDDQLDVPVRPDAEQTIVAGAKRLRRRRLAAVTATGAAAVVAVVAIGVALALPNQEAMPPADFPTTTTTTTTTEPSVSETVPTPADTAPPAAPPTEGDPAPGPNPPGDTVAPPPAGPEVSGERLGPHGLGTLRLGMDVESAMATGMVGDGAPPGTGCVSRPLLIDGQASGEVYFGDRGLQIIAPGVPVHTVDGVSVGWTTAEFVARYPDEQGAAENGTAYLAVSGNPDAIYRVVFTDDRISRIQLRMADQICD